jgi:regulator of PEP synthase PpsR (kinase-PPPase family)
MKKQLNIHLISDSTGETLSFIVKAVLSQFPEIQVKEFHYFLTRTVSQMEKHLNSIIEMKGIVIYTVLDETMEKLMQDRCNQHNILCIPAISQIVKQFADYLGMKNIKNIGRQHQVSDEYYKKMEAINYTIAHDDGNLANDLQDADIIILGVSRSSKSPTSVYLAYKGYKVGNIPFVKSDLIPKYIKDLKKPLIVGLTIDAERLKTIRQTRIKTLEVKDETDYTDIMRIEEEVIEAKKFFGKLEIPVINVTEKSIEETAVYIINLFDEHNKNLNFQ